MLRFVASKLPGRWLTWISGLQYRIPWMAGLIQWGADRVRGADGVIQRGIGKGLKFNTTANAGYLFGTSEPDVQRALSVMIQPGTVVYDVGANIGFMSVLAARLTGPGGRVVCFEPLVENQKQIAHNAGLNKFSHISVHGVALSDRESTVRFAVSSISTIGHIANEETEENKRLPVQFEKFIDVPACRLDGLIEREKLPAPNLIKMDVEGAEGAVLRGAAATLKSARPLLLIELHGTNQAVCDILAGANYSVHVLGSDDDARTAHWNSHVIAVPAELPNAAALSERLCAGMNRGGAA